MKDSLIDILEGLRQDPTLVVELYKKLFDSSYFTLVRPGTETSIEEMEFLTYDTQDDIRELPLFTNDLFILKGLTQEALTIQVSGQPFWARLLDIIETGVCEVAVNPGQKHGIRLTKEMILGMIANYSPIQILKDNNAS